MLEEREILNKELIVITIERLCHQLIEVHNTFDNAVLIGVQPRGTYLNNRILKKLKLIVPNSNIKSGNVDISFYRDDLMRRDKPIVPEIMDIHLSLEEKNIILIDDVLFTGRSIRSAIDALMTFGRPKSVELLTLIDRRFSRDLPIQPNYVGKKIDAMESEKIIVEWEETTGIDRVLMRKSK
ncbi:MAG: bifunctional pyr operon transcriptional regulator/uracil phosphoribosyltransferase PyrR [Bacteroidota bacterium]|nr:bifunctional pyr operon transcriptional regulator/uracil phosphoribosyltransferase PyrR [Bacteroidota bacterium]